MTEGLVIKTDLTTEELADISLETLQKSVGGWIQPVDFPEFTMWVNEEGKLIEGMAINAFATQLFQTQFGAIDYIMGDVVFTGGADENGDTLPLSESVRAKLERVLAM